MKVYLLAKSRNREAADTFAAKLRANGTRVLRGNLQHWHRGDSVTEFDTVYHDQTNPDIVADCREQGVPCKPFLTDMEAVARVEVEATPPTVEPENEPEVEVVENGVWYTVLVDGEKVGKSKRSREQALAQLEAA